MNRPSPIRQQLVVAAFVLGLWALLLLAFSGQLVFTSDLDWLEALRLSLRAWLPWALLAGPVVWIAGRFPLERNRLLVSVPVHLVACMLAVLFCDVMARPLPAGLNAPFPGDRPLRFRGGRPDNPPPPAEPGPPRDGVSPPEGPRFLQERRRRAFMTGLVLRAQFNIPIYWVIVSVVHSFSFYRRSRERERQAAELEARLADAKLDALRMQLHPHFLFNTLNSIATLVHKDPQAADEMIGNLSELLRSTLDADQQEIPLRRELELLDRYLEIQQVRFGDRLRLEKVIDAATLDAFVPSLILQPLVENAVRHGIEQQPAGGQVRIETRRRGDVLGLAVRNRGAAAAAPARESSGIGLANTRNRLRELYGDRARLTLLSGAEGDFSVEIEVPFHETALPARNAASASP